MNLKISGRNKMMEAFNLIQTATLLRFKCESLEIFGDKYTHLVK
jgi:hypothetical protein